MDGMKTRWWVLVRIRLLLSISNRVRGQGTHEPRTTELWPLKGIQGEDGLS